MDGEKTKQQKRQQGRNKGVAVVGTCGSFEFWPERWNAFGKAKNKAIWPVYLFTT